MNDYFLNMAENFYKLILENIYEGIYFVDSNMRITFWNKGAERITGFSFNEIVGKTCADNILRHIDNSGKELCIYGCPLSKTLKDGQVREADVFLHHKEGHRLPVMVRVSPIFDENGLIIGAAELFAEKNVYAHTEVLSELESLKKEVYTDHLTQIGNRKYGEMSLDKLHMQFLAYSINYGIILMDIDNFKSVNDVYGHDIGDKVLQMVAKTAGSSLRSIDVLYRMGGEEFVIIIPNCDEKTLFCIAERTRILIANSFLTLDESQLKVTVSIGIQLSAPGIDINTMLKKADEKLYISKRSGKNKVTA